MHPGSFFFPLSLSSADGASGGRKIKIKRKRKEER
jgi:hypothetical protein